MKRLTIGKCNVTLGILLLASCSTAPHARMLTFLASGETYIKAGKYQEAVIEFRNAVQIDPKSATAHYQLARAYMSLGNRAAAYRDFEESVSLDAGNVDAQLQLAALLIDRKEYDRAQTMAEQVLDKDPKNAQAHVIFGQRHALAND